MSHVIEIIAQDNNLCGEAPIWDGRCGCLYWADIDGSLVFCLDTRTGEKSVLSRGLSVSGIALNRGPGLVFAGATGLHFREPSAPAEGGPAAGQYRTLLTDYQGEALWFNDIIADPRGRIYAGTFYWGPNGMEKLGRLYLIGPDGSIRVVDEGIEASNGLAFSPDDRTLYFTDTIARRIYAYDVDAATGDLRNRRTLVQVSTDEGIPDGLTVDSEGFLWSAQWYGGQVVRYDPEGRIAGRIRMPVLQVSSAMFAGPDLTDLYITTAAASWKSSYAPPGYDFDAPNIGGSLYRVRLDVRGRPEHLADFA